MANNDQLEELEALRSIYDSDLTEISVDPPCFMVKLSDLDVELNAPLSLKFTFPMDYPSALPIIEIPLRSNVICASQHQNLLHHLNVQAEDSIGSAMVFTLVSCAEQWVNDHMTATAEEDYESTEDEKSEVMVPVKLEDPKLSGGRWEYVIGLVGKPSAGKSTFFNAATTHDLARTGAHPFTTIEPNIGKAYYSIPCPCQGSDRKCDAEYGHNFLGERYVPVLIKDVAGLVPGAWEGKGRGNRFLNDLLDADVLIHIVDASGTTNEKGEETMDYDPANDVHWLKQELHQWIHQNIMAKWDNLIKRPSKLIDMFTGYHANKATIYAALHNAGISEKELSSLASWNDSILHKIVDQFLAVRFPMLLVLNKADKPESSEWIQRLLEKFPDEATIAVSAKTECILQKMAKDGKIRYMNGNSDFDIISGLSDNPDISQEVTDIKRNVLQRFESTNVHNSLSKAVKLREPAYVFPVHCVKTLQSIHKDRGNKDLILRDCISLKPGTKVEDVHKILCHYPVNLLSGDFVRAETIGEDGKMRPAKKEEIVTTSNNILKIMTTKKTS